MNNKVGIVSGYFNPIHMGHIQYINAAKEKCDFLICIINNDKQVALKKSDIFMDEQHRSFIVQNIKAIDSTIISIDEDASVAKTLEYIITQLPKNVEHIYFFNSGDRSINNQNDKEVQYCISNNIERVFIPLPKIFSSSELKRHSSSNNIK